MANDRNSYISVSGIEYNKAEASTISSTDEVGTKVPITFSFLYEPSETTFSNSTFDVKIFTFDVGDYHVMEYTISAWNPNSTPGSNIANAMVNSGFTFIDTEGMTGDISPSTNNLGLITYFQNNQEVGVDVNETTSLNGIGGTAHTLFGGDGGLSTILYFNVDLSNTVNVKIRKLKKGFRVKGLITLS